MIIAIGVVLGILIGLVSPLHVPTVYSSYVAIAIIASLDSVFGGISAMSRKCFDFKIFISGFFGNALLAALLTFIGKKLDVDLYLVALIVFGTRLFNNFSTIRRYYLDKWASRQKT